MGKMKDRFGNRMKMYEAVEASRTIMPRLPVYARLDGRSFSTFTRGLEYPDKRLVNLMGKAAKVLINETHATIAYTQSDEISLAWNGTDTPDQFFFGGRVQKLVSVLSGLASSAFARDLKDVLPEKGFAVPTFDCRIVQFPTEIELANMFLWRVRDCIKNSIGLTAQKYFSHKELKGISSAERMDMLMLQKGINWNDFDTNYKEGWWYRRVTRERDIPREELEKIPPEHRPVDGRAFRSGVELLNMPRFDKVINKPDVILGGEKPRYIYM